MWDLTARVALHGIDGLARRMEVRADNVANVNTPGFRASHVDFESSLRTAIQRNAVPSSHATIESPTIIDRTNNSVDLETELIGAMRDQVHRDGLTAAFNFKSSQLRVSLGGAR